MVHLEYCHFYRYLRLLFYLFIFILFYILYFIFYILYFIFYILFFIFYFLFYFVLIICIIIICLISQIVSVSFAVKRFEICLGRWEALYKLNVLLLFTHVEDTWVKIKVQEQHVCTEPETWNVYKKTYKMQRPNFLTSYTAILHHFSVNICNRTEAKHMEQNCFTQTKNLILYKGYAY